MIDTHVGELGPVYGILQGAQGAERQAGARVIDLVVGERLPLPEHPGWPAESLPCLAAAVEAAHPDRDCIGYILHSYAGWLDVAGPARAKFLEDFPRLAPAAHDLGEEGMRMVLSALRRDSRAVSLVGVYSMTTPEAARAMARIVDAAPADMVARLVAVFPAEKMEQSKDAERFLPALGEVPQALSLAVALAARDISTAYAVCRRLPAVLKSHANAGVYLEDFEVLAGTIGPRVAGWCLKTLPGLYAKHGLEAARNFVTLAAQTARDYGALAGEAFVERKTQAAREALESSARR